MAKIILEPGEIFEHSHEEISYTKLIKGKGMLQIGGKEISLKVGKKVNIPGGVPHVLVNKGSSELAIQCAHEINARAK